ncbi:MAG: glycosyltransferase [Muribaculaceae bacterium]|nr:glycosyltransferase [Muribaculaceae bacterium]
MKITIINHSDNRGGAAIVSFRLMEALRRAGHDAVMLVAHKYTDSPHVYAVGPKWRLDSAFVAEHLQILAGNGLRRRDMFKVSTAAFGMPLSRHPLVLDADAVMLNWVNQGMLSLREIARIAGAKPTVWTMHDMWCMTGVCHYAGVCTRFTATPGCGCCPELHSSSRRDLSRRTWSRKVDAYARRRIHFVAVSHWLKGLATQSSLMRGQRVDVIPNAFPVDSFYINPRSSRASLGLPEGKKIMIMSAARLDVPVKGLDLAIDALNRLDRTDAIALFVGALRDPHALDNLRFPHISYGAVSDPALLRELYAHSTVLMSTARYETLPTTLIEGQAAGCTPVAFDSSGQCDIISNADEGILVPSFDTSAYAAALGRALDAPLEPSALRASVERRYAADRVADAYIALLASLTRLSS